jgi:hypothetical protein
MENTGKFKREILRKNYLSSKYSQKIKLKYASNKQAVPVRKQTE